jgi:hypothetical protein
MKYWQNEGKHTDLFEKIWAKLVPTTGESDSEVGEVVRAFGRINYECFNSGNGNMYEEQEVDGYSIWDCEDEDEREYEYVMIPFYEEFFATIEEFLGWRKSQALIEDVKCEMLSVREGCSQSRFENTEKLDEMADQIGDKILKDYPDVVPQVSQDETKELTL